MLIPGQNQLADPEIVEVEAFEPLLASFKAEVVAHVASRSAENGARLAETLENNSELLTSFLQACTVRLQTHARKYNERIRQMLAWWATGRNLDARLADVGLDRQVLDPGDMDAFPPVEPTYESDEDARLRYYLAPHAPAAGSRAHYRREVLTLGGRPAISVEASAAGVVTVTYTFAQDSYAAQVKDGNARRTAPGKVLVTVLSRLGNGIPSEALLQATRAHFARDDVRPETDEVTVAAAEIVEYRIRAVAKINSGPDAALTQATAIKDLQAYADSCHALGGRVDTTWIDYTLHKAGALQLEVLEPQGPITCTDGQAPYCTDIDVEVQTL